VAPTRTRQALWAAVGASWILRWSVWIDVTAIPTPRPPISSPTYKFTGVRERREPGHGPVDEEGYGGARFLPRSNIAPPNVPLRVRGDRVWRPAGFDKGTSKNRHFHTRAVFRRDGTGPEGVANEPEADQVVDRDERLTAESQCLGE
jgi:hypothetical protein